MQQESAADESPLVLDPLNARCLPPELQEQLLHLLDARSLLSCRCVSRCWRDCVDSSRAWLHQARILGVEEEPMSGLMQRVALLLGGNCSISCTRVDVEEESGGLNTCEEVAHASYENGQLKLLIHNSHLNRFRVCHVTVNNGGAASQSKDPIRTTGKNYVKMRYDAGGLLFSILPLFGITDSTSPLLLVDKRASYINLLPCSCSQIRVLCALDNVMVMWPLNPAAAGEMRPQQLQPRCKLPFDSMIMIVPCSGSEPRSSEPEQFVIAAEGKALYLVRVGCSQLQLLRHMQDTANPRCRLVSPFAFGAGVFTLGKLENGRQDVANSLYIVQHRLSKCGTMDSCGFEYELCEKFTIDNIKFACDFGSHLLLCFKAEEGELYEVALYRHGIVKPLLQLQLPGFIEDKTCSSCPLCSVQRVLWSHGLDPGIPRTPLFCSLQPDSMFHPLSWDLRAYPTPNDTD